jgi:hypothetical protein
VASKDRAHGAGQSSQSRTTTRSPGTGFSPGGFVPMPSA